MVYKSGPIFLPFCHNPRVWQTDGRTDRQTDGRTEISSQYRVCITCSAVKTVAGCWADEAATVIVCQWHHVVDRLEWRVDTVDSLAECRRWSCQIPPLSDATHRHIQTDTQRHIQTEIQTDTQRHIQTDTQTHTDRHTDT